MGFELFLEVDAEDDEEARNGDRFPGEFHPFLGIATEGLEHVHSCTDADDDRNEIQEIRDGEEILARESVGHVGSGGKKTMQKLCF